MVPFVNGEGKPKGKPNQTLVFKHLRHPQRGVKSEPGFFLDPAAGQAALPVKNNDTKGPIFDDPNDIRKCHSRSTGSQEPSPSIPTDSLVWSQNGRQLLQLHAQGLHGGSAALHVGIVDHDIPKDLASTQKKKKQKKLQRPKFQAVGTSPGAQGPRTLPMKPR